MTHIQHAAISATVQRKSPTDLLPDTGLTTEIYRTVHSAAATVDEIAHRLAIASNYLYRACLLPPAGRSLPATKLVPLMRTTGDYRILDHLAAQCDRAVVNLPRVAALKKLDANIIAILTADHHRVLAAAVSYIGTPGSRTDCDRIVRDLTSHIGSLAALRRAVRSARQGDLF